jgi:hypothetical protein
VRSISVLKLLALIRPGGRRDNAAIAKSSLEKPPTFRVQILPVIASARRLRPSRLQSA